MKRKLTALICAASLALTAIIAPHGATSTTTEPESLYCDARPVNIEDVLDILKELVDLNEEVLPLELYDFNGNGEIDIGDALECLKGMVGIDEEKSLPVDCKTECETCKNPGQSATTANISTTKSGSTTDTEIDFLFFQGRVVFPNFEERTYIIRSLSELNEVLSAESITFINDFIPEFDESFFETKSLVVYNLNSSMCNVIFNLSIEKNTLLINATMGRATPPPPVMVIRQFVFLVERAELEKVNEVKVNRNFILFRNKECEPVTLDGFCWHPECRRYDELNSWYNNWYELRKFKGE